jgi:ABC-type transport system substrate-binding protein
MSEKKSWKIIGAVLLVAQLALGACAPKEPQVVEKVVRETVVQKEIVKETVIVEGTPKVKVVTATPETTSASSSPLVTCDSSDAESLNPILYNDTAWQYSIALLYNALVQWNPEDASILPDLAESWEVSDDDLTVTYHLRQGVKWHDGHPGVLGQASLAAIGGHVHAGAGAEPPGFADAPADAGGHPVDSQRGRVESFCA